MVVHYNGGCVKELHQHFGDRNVESRDSNAGIEADFNYHYSGRLQSSILRDLKDAREPFGNPTQNKEHKLVAGPSTEAIMRIDAYERLQIGDCDVAQIST